MFHIQCAAKFLNILDVVDTHSYCDEFTNAESLIDRQLVYQNKSADSKWMGISEELKSNSSKPKNSMLLVSKTLKIAYYVIWQKKLYRCYVFY